MIFGRFCLKLLHILNILFFEQMIILIGGIVDWATNWPVDQSLSESIDFVLFLITWQSSLCFISLVELLAIVQILLCRNVSYGIALLWCLRLRRVYQMVSSMIDATRLAELDCRLAVFQCSGRPFHLIGTSWWSRNCIAWIQSLSIRGCNSLRYICCVSDLFAPLFNTLRQNLRSLWSQATKAQLSFWVAVGEKLLCSTWWISESSLLRGIVQSFPWSNASHRSTFSFEIICLRGVSPESTHNLSIGIRLVEWILLRKFQVILLNTQILLTQIFKNLDILGWKLRFRMITILHLRKDINDTKYPIIQDFTISII